MNILMIMADQFRADWMSCAGTEYADTPNIGKTDLHKGDHFYGEKGDLLLMYHLGFIDIFETEGKMNACFRRHQTHNPESKFENYSRDADIPDSSLAGPY